MNTIYVVALEPIPTRYTWEWFTHIPAMLNKYIAKNNLDLKVVQIDALEVISCSDTTSGAFLNFAATNVWKSVQLQKIATLINDGKINNGDVFYFTDAWNPAIIQLRYMLSLMRIDATIHAQWHAGYHDPYDQLNTRLVYKDNRWIVDFERSLFHAIDYNYFTTDFYLNLFTKNVLTEVYTQDKPGYQYQNVLDYNKICKAGYPLSYLIEKANELKNIKKENLVIFPHRLAKEKNPQRFAILKKIILEKRNDIKFVVAMEENLSKEEYWKLMSKSKIAVSFAQQETYGIAMVEATLFDTIPFVPDDLSYKEMYFDDFKYDTKTFDYHLLAERIIYAIDNPINYFVPMKLQKEKIIDNFIGDELICKSLCVKPVTM